MQVSPEQPIYSEAPLQLLLFVDGRPNSRQQVQRIRAYLKQLEAKFKFELQIIEVAQQPYLAEHFKLVATPALVKIHPEPRHVLAGSHIITELKDCWSHWQASAEAYTKLHPSLQENIEENGRLGEPQSLLGSIGLSAEMITLSDEIFHLKQEKEKLQEQLQFKERVIAMLAHDLRNPLTAMAIAIETLDSNYNLEKGEFERLTPAMAVHLFKQARSQTKIIDRMITGLLQVGRTYNQEFVIQPQKMQLGKLCLEILEELSDQYTRKSLTIKKDIPQDLPYVYADPERIRQVLINLLDNAIKYTPENGIITISGLHRTTQKVQFSIGDTGPGIPENDRERIFENRFRLERDGAVEGYGIGLCLCQRIVHGHYGRIWVDSSPNGGAWFHFTLPVYPN